MWNKVKVVYKIPGSNPGLSITKHASWTVFQAGNFLKVNFSSDLLIDSIQFLFASGIFHEINRKGNSTEKNYIAVF